MNSIKDGAFESKIFQNHNLQISLSFWENIINQAFKSIYKTIDGPEQTFFYAPNPMKKSGSEKHAYFVYALGVKNEGPFGLFKIIQKMLSNFLGEYHPSNFGAVIRRDFEFDYDVVDDEYKVYFRCKFLSREVIEDLQQGDNWRMKTGKRKPSARKKE